jgi:hypothetical protein
VSEARPNAISAGAHAQRALSFLHIQLISRNGAVAARRQRA